jgi:glycerol kinase
LGITNQRETAIVWDRKSGLPIHNAIVWQDRRTAGICRRLADQGLEASIQRKTGLLIDPYFSATKVMWLLDNVPDARKKANAGELAFGTVDSWLIWKVTGGKHHVTDSTNASRTMLFNIHDQQWDAELLAAMGIPASILPEVVPSSGIIGPSTESGLADIPIAGIAGDQQAALFGQACFRRGMAKCTYGTGAFLLQNTGDEAKPSSHRLLTTVAWRLKERTEYAM